MLEHEREEEEEEENIDLEVGDEETVEIDNEPEDQKTIRRDLVEKARRLDVYRRIGAGTPGAEEDVKKVGQLLVEEGLLSYSGEGAFDNTMRRALDQFGTLEELAEKHGYVLVDGEEQS